MATLLLVTVAACAGDEATPRADTLRQVETGTLKGEVYRALGPGPVDSTRYEGRSEYGYPLSRFLVEGEGVEVVWVPQAGYAPGDSIEWREATPILFRNIAMLGWGWDQVEPLAEELRIVFPGMPSYRAPDEGGVPQDAGEAPDARPEIHEEPTDG